jgi:hypothetical protein
MGKEHDSEIMTGRAALFDNDGKHDYDISFNLSVDQIRRIKAIVAESVNDITDRINSEVA